MLSTQGPPPDPPEHAAQDGDSYLTPNRVVPFGRMPSERNHDFEPLQNQPIPWFLTDGIGPKGTTHFCFRPSASGELCRGGCRWGGICTQHGGAPAAAEASAGTDPRAEVLRAVPTDTLPPLTS